MNAVEYGNGHRIAPTRKCAQPGFTLIEILMAMFIMSLGVVGVMSLFPVGLESTRIAMDATMTDIIGRTGVAMMQCYMNTSEIYDCGTGAPGVGGTVRWRNPSRSCVLDSTDYKTTIRYWRQHSCWVSGTQNLNGFYLRFVKGTAAGQIRRIDDASGNLLTIDTDYPSPLNKVPQGLARNQSKLIVTRYGFPMQWKPVRLGIVKQVGSDSINPTNILDHDLDGDPAIPWGGGQWGGGQYFILFTGGKAQGRLLRVRGGGKGGISVKAGAINLETDGVRAGDTFSVLGCEDVRPCTFPPNFGGTSFNTRFETPPVIPYYTTPVPQNVKVANSARTDFSMFAEYSYVCIISTVDAPVPLFEELGRARTARIDVVVYRHYMRHPEDPKTWLPLEEQSPAVGVFTGFIPPL